MDKKVLCVGDTSADFESVRRELSALEAGWQLECVLPGEPTWNALDARSWDAVIVDQPVDGQDLTPVLETAMRKVPQAHRVLLVDLGSPETLFRRIGGVHQLLVKPCETSRLRKPGR